MTSASRRAPSSCRARRARTPLPVARRWRRRRRRWRLRQLRRSRSPRRPPPPAAAARWSRAQVGGERGGERAHKARAGALLAERRDERRVAPRPRRATHRLAASTRPRRASSGRRRALLRPPRRRAGMPTPRSQGRAARAAELARRQQVEVVLLQHHQPRKWHQRRRRERARSARRLAVGTQPVLSQQQLLEAVERPVAVQRLARARSVHNGPSAGALGAAATTGGAPAMRRRWQRSRGSGGGPVPPCRILSVAWPKSAASTVTRARHAAVCRSAWSWRGPVAPTRLRRAPPPPSSGSAAAAAAKFGPSPPASARARHERVRVGERGVGVAGTAEGAPSCLRSGSRSVRRSSSRRASCARVRRSTCEAPRATAARHPTSAACREFGAARARAAREPRVRGAVVVARERRRRAAQVHQLQREHKIVGQRRPVWQPAWRPPSSASRNPDYRQCLRAVLCQKAERSSRSSSPATKSRPAMSVSCTDAREELDSAPCSAGAPALAASAAIDGRPASRHHTQALTGRLLGGAFLQDLVET